MSWIFDGDWCGIPEDKKIKYYAIDNVEVLYKLAGAGGNDPW